MLGFGGLVLAAVFVVLMLGLWSARENTVSLTRKLAEAVLDDVQSAIEQRLTPAEAAVAYLGSRIEAGRSNWRAMIWPRPCHRPWPACPK